MISVDLPAQECLDAIVDSPYTRYPAYRGSVDEIVGILHVRDLFKALYDRGIDNVEIEELLRPPYLVPETKDLAALLTEFRRTNQHMAIVVDEYGSMQGIVTLEDLLEEIVGEIEDEYDLPGRVADADRRADRARRRHVPDRRLQRAVLRRAPAGGLPHARRLRLRRAGPRARGGRRGGLERPALRRRRGRRRRASSSSTSSSCPSARARARARRRRRTWRSRGRRRRHAGRAHAWRRAPTCSSGGWSRSRGSGPRWRRSSPGSACARSATSSSIGLTATSCRCPSGRSPTCLPSRRWRSPARCAASVSGVRADGSRSSRPASRTARARSRRPGSTRRGSPRSSSPGRESGCADRSGATAFTVKSYDLNGEAATADFAPGLPGDRGPDAEADPRARRPPRWTSPASSGTRFPQHCARPSGFPRARDALRALHQPVSLAQAEEGRRRLAFDELLVFQLGLARRRRGRESQTAPAFGEPGELAVALPVAPALHAHRRPGAGDRRDRRRSRAADADGTAAPG